MRKIAIAFLPQCRSIHAKRGPASFLSLRSLATVETEYPSANAEDGAAGASSGISMGASETRKAPEKKKVPRLKRGKSGRSQQDLRDALGQLPAQISTVEAKARAKVKTITDSYTEVPACVVATKKAASSAHAVARRNVSELTETRVIEAENLTVCENAALGKGEKDATCARATANASSLQEELTEIIEKLDLSTYKHGRRWEEIARKLLDHGIPLADIVSMLKKCRKLRSSTLWVDSTFKNLSLLGMSHEEMGKVFAKWPSIVIVPDGTLWSKIDLLEGIGVDRCTLIKILYNSSMTITMSLITLRQNIAFWNDYMHDVHTNAVCIMLSKNPELLTYKAVKQKLAWLKAQAFDKKWLVRHSVILGLSLPVLISKAELLESFGILNARKRSWVLAFSANLRTSTLQTRFDNLLTAGFSRDQSIKIICESPIVLACTEDHINVKLDYLFNVMNVSVDVIVSAPSLWTRNLERRIKYRYEVIKRLQSLGVLDHGPSLGYMVSMTNENFTRRFFERFKDVVKQADAPGG